MNPAEQYRRCQSARRVLGGTGVGKTIMCKVYGRTVSDCRDCAFSILQRPIYLKHIAGGEDGDRHTIMEEYYVCDVAEDRNRSYQDKYYPIGRYCRAPSYRDEPELLHGRRAY